MQEGIVTGQFSDSYFPIMDGVTVTVCNYLLELSRILGPTYAVVPYIPGCERAPIEPTIRFFSLPLIGRPPYRIGFPQLDSYLHRALSKYRFDLIHIHSPFFTGRFAVDLARRRRIPVVATFHSRFDGDLESLIPFPRVVDRAMRSLSGFYARVDQVWVSTESARQALRQYGFNGPVEIVSTGIDLQLPDNRIDRSKEGQRFMRVQDHDTVFLYVGQLDWKKNHAFLLESLSLLKQSGRRFKMVFIGEGYAARSMKTRSEHLGIAEDTIFRGVLRDRTILSACYARADCLLFPSLSETCGLVVKEAAAFGVPSVLIQGCAAAEGIQDGINGFIVENSVESYAQKLALLLDDPQIMVAAGENARRTLCMSWKEAAQEVKDRYLCLLRGTPSVTVAKRPFAGLHSKEE
jgi:glycosyltransferase involved in cell wall biosynthesis